jgi:hypothetical protein
MTRIIQDVRRTALLSIVAATLACNQASTAPHERFTLQAQIAAADGTAAKALKADIAGTNISARTDAAGRFSFSAAPQGPSTLHLSGPGLDTSIRLPGLDEGLVVSVSVGLSNEGKGSLKSQPEAQLRGTVASAKGNDLRIAASTIHVDKSTQFDGDAPALAKLVGQVVDVQGRQDDDGSIRATRIHGGGKDKKDIEFRGAIDAISGLDVVAAGKTIHTTAATKFEIGEKDATFSSLAVGQTIEAKGSLNADGSILASAIEIQTGVAPPPPPPPPPAPPVANAGAAQTVSSGAVVTLDSSASADATGIALTYSWTQTAGPAITLSSATASSPFFTAPNVPFNQPAAILTFSLVVSDANGASAPSTVSIAVSPQPPPPPPAAPTADAGLDQAVASGAFVTLDGTASSDPSALALNFAWTQTAGPIVTLSSASSTTPSFTAPTVPFGQPAAVLAFSLVVSDANASSAPSIVQITVNAEPPPNPAPVANAGPDQAVASHASVTLDGSASADPDGEAITFAWTQTSGAAVTLAGADTASPTFTAPVVPASSAAATLAFSLVVTDAHASSAAASVTITVNPAAANFPTPPGTPPPADPNQVIQPLGGNGSHRFEVGSQQGLYLQDAGPGEPSVRGFVVVTLGSPASGTGFLPPADTVVTMNGVPLLRDPNLNGTFFRVDPAGPQPKIGTGGQMVLVATGTDPQSGKPIQRSLVLPCPRDITVSSTPAIGSSLAGSPSVTITSPSDITFNVGVVIAAGNFPQATLFGFDRATRTFLPSGSPLNIAPGPLSTTVPVKPTTGDAYLLDLRWPGTFILDGQTGGFCGLAKRWTYTK